jgi:hypothetical protein
MPFSEYGKWSTYFKQKQEEMDKESKGGGRNLLESPEALVKGLT